MTRYLPFFQPFQIDLLICEYTSVCPPIRFEAKLMWVVARARDHFRVDFSRPSFYSH